MYDPAIGRWFVVDPMANHELQIDKSPYAYGWNNPIKYIDPNGLCPNGCSDSEKSGDPYRDGAVVQNKYGTSQYVDGEWVTISSTPDGSGENTSTDENGGGNGSGGGSSSEGNGFFGSSGWGDMAGTLNGIGQIATFYGGLISTKGFVTYNEKTWTGKNGKIYSQSSLYKDYYGKGGKYVRGVQGLRNSANMAMAHANKLKAIGRGVGGLNIILTSTTAVMDGKITAGEFTKIGIGVLTIAGPIGWGYGVADIGVQIFTGQSITDRVGDYVDKHW
jgi:hypothetical protein